MVKLTNSIGIEMVQIPAGEYLMGSSDGDVDALDSEKPQRRVRITEPFFLGIYPVTQRQFQRVMRTNPSRFRGFNRPVESTYWNDVTEFCHRLSVLPDEMAIDRMYRLPTEAEWEYTCRAGSATRYCFGDDAALLGEYAWCGDNSGYQTHPVGQKKPNAWGLYDMHGNVWERCSDWASRREFPNRPSPYPVGFDGRLGRAVRGGGWHDSAALCRTAYRYLHSADWGGCGVGFRVAASPDAQLL